MKFLFGAVLALVYQAQLIQAGGDHGLAERIFAYGAYVAEGIQGINPSTIAPGCTGAGGGRCNMDEFVRHIDANPSSIKPSNYFAMINQNNFDRFSFAQLKGAFYTEYKKNNGKVPSGNIDARKLVPSVSSGWYGDAVQHMGAVVNRARGVTLNSPPAQSRLSAAVDKCKVALQFSLDKRLAQMDDPNIGGDRVKYLQNNVGAPRNPGLPGGGNIKTKPGSNPLIKSYRVLDVQATMAAFHAQGLGDVNDASGKPKSELAWHMSNYENDPALQQTSKPKTHLSMLRAMATAGTAVGCRAPG